MCPFSELISAYRDGELDAQASAAMQQHLSQCPACRAELAELEAMSRLLMENPAPRLSQIALHRIHAQADLTARQDVLRLARALQAIAACVLVVASIWLMRSPGSLTNQESVQAEPPWLDVAMITSAQTKTVDATTPAAVWYLAGVSSRSDDSP
jgi:anti-sigma factor RsiW